MMKHKSVLTKYMRPAGLLIAGAMLTSALSAGLTGGAQAAEVTLRAVSAFAPNTTFSKRFEEYIKRVNETGKGKIKINYVGGGGAVMSPFQLGGAVKSGAVDIGSLPGAYYTNLMPEVDALKLSEYSAAEERKNGAWEFINKLHEEKVNARHLARHKDCVPFHLYLNKPLKTMDMKGLKIRVTPIYRNFFSSLGADMIRTKPGDVYSALESGVVDGYGWPTQGVLDLGWHEVTKYRVDPAFYRSSVEILMNLDKWKKLNDEQRKVLNDASTWLEAKCSAEQKINSEEIARQTKAGIKAISFDGEEGKKWLAQAKKAGWDGFLKANPKNGPKLKELLTR